MTLSILACSLTAQASPGEGYDAFSSLLKNTLHGSPEAIAQVQKVYGNLVRDPKHEAELIQLKYQYMLWRQQEKEICLKRIRSQKDELLIERHLIGLYQLQKTLTDSDLKTLMVVLKHFPQNPKIHSEILKIFADRLPLATLRKLIYSGQFHGPDKKFLIQRAGPLENIVMPPVVPSRYKEKGWFQSMDLTNYQINGHYLHYRGITLQTGDLLLVDLSHLSGGLFASFIGEGGYAGHIAMFVMLKEKGKSIPAIIEMHQNGIRAIPVSTFFDPAETHYFEVFRPKTQIDTDRMSSETSKLLANNHFKYDFTLPEKFDFYGDAQTCASLIFSLNERSGFTRTLNESALTPKAELNLKMLGTSTHRILTPTDFILSDDYRFVGLIDHQDAVSQIAIHLMVRQIGQLIENKELDLKALPEKYISKQKGIQWILDHPKVGMSMLWLFKVDRDHFALGTSSIISFMEALDSYSEEANRENLPALEAKIHAEINSRGLLTLSELGQTSEISNLIQQATGKIHLWFH